MTPRLGALLTHPIQYYSPWLAALARKLDLKVYYAHRQDASGQAEAGFGVNFEWDIPLLEGYAWEWLDNVSARPGLATFDGCDTPQIADIVRRERFDALMLFGWNKKSFLQAWQAAMRAGTPVFVRLDSQLVGSQITPRNLAKRAAYALVLPWSADYLSPGRRTDAYLRHFAVPASRIHRLPHMVDTERFATAAEAARLDGTAEGMRANHGAVPSIVVFVFVGKLIEKKRPDLLLRAFAQLPPCKAQLWYVGDGPMSAYLKRLAEREGLPVRFLGFMNQTELPALYAAADCLVLPSNARETWGLVVNEAMACRLPSIVSIEAGCAEELIRDGETGWLLRAPDHRMLTDLLLRACGEVRTLPRAAMATQSARCSFDVGASILLDILRQIHDRRQRRMA